MVTSATISCVSGKQQIRLFTVLWLNTWYEQVNISGWGTQGRCRYSAVSLITRFDFMAPVTRVITALQCMSHSMQASLTKNEVIVRLFAISCLFPRPLPAKNGFLPRLSVQFCFLRSFSRKQNHADSLGRTVVKTGGLNYIL